jgi:hypothetical protein
MKTLINLPGERRAAALHFALLLRTSVERDFGNAQCKLQHRPLHAHTGNDQDAKAIISAARCVDLKPVKRREAPLPAI